MASADDVPADFVCVRHERDGRDCDGGAWAVYVGGEHVVWSWNEADADRAAAVVRAALAARTEACARVAEAHAEAHAAAETAWLAMRPTEEMRFATERVRGALDACRTLADCVRAVATGGGDCGVCAAAIARDIRALAATGEGGE